MKRICPKCVRGNCLHHGTGNAKYTDRETFYHNEFVAKPRTCCQCGEKLIKRDYLNKDTTRRIENPRTCRYCKYHLAKIRATKQWKIWNR